MSEINFDKGTDIYLEFPNKLDEPTAKKPSVVEAEDTLHAAATGKDFIGVKMDRDANAPREQAAIQNAHDKVAQNNIKIVETAMGSDGAPTQEELDEIRGGMMLGSYLEPDIEALMAEGGYGRNQRRVLSRMMAFEKAVVDRLPQDLDDDEGMVLGAVKATGSFVGRLGEAIVTDMIAPLSGEVDTQLAAVDFAEEIYNAMQTSQSDEEFMAVVEPILARLDDRGVFSESNPAEIYNLVNLVGERFSGESGSGQLAQLGTAMGVVDLATLGTTGIARGAAIKAITGSRHVLTQSGPEFIQKVSSRAKAIKVGYEVVKAKPNSPAAMKSALPSSMLPDAQQTATAVGPNNSILHRWSQESATLSDMNSSFTGTGLSKTQIEEAGEAAQAAHVSLNKLEKNIVADHVSTVDMFDNVTTTVTYGRSGGKPFVAKKDGTPPKAAVDMADRLGGRLEETVFEGKKAYTVKADVNANTNMISEATDLDDLSSKMFAPLLSTTARTAGSLNAALKAGEAGTARVLTEAGKRWSKAQRKAGKQGVEELNTVYDDLMRSDKVTLSDGRVISATDPLDEFAYRDIYTTKFGKEPTEAQMNLWREYNDVSNTDWFIRADAELKKRIANNETMLADGDAYLRAKSVDYDQVPNDVKVYDQSQNRMVSAADIKDGKYRVFKLEPSEAEGISLKVGQQVDYVVSTKPKTRKMYHRDALGYNLGGHRFYDSSSNYFIKAMNPNTGSFRTFMKVRSKDQAIAVREQFKELMDARLAGTLTDDMIKSRAAFNAELNTVDDFENFLKDYNIFDNAEVDFHLGGEALSSGGFTTTAANSFANTAAVNGKRGTKPLAEYGGMEATYLKPTEAVARAFVSTSAQFGYAKYMKRSMEGLLKTALKQEKVLRNADEIKSLVRNGKLRQAVEQMDIIGDDAVANKLRNERYTIRTASGAKSNSTKFLEAKQDAIQTAIIDSKLPLKLKWAAGKIVGTDGGNTMSQILRSTAFNLKLGLFAWDQIYVQGMTALTAGAIGSARLGVMGSYRSIANYPALNIAMHLDDGLRPAFAKEMHKVMGYDTPEEFMDFLKFSDESGRFILNNAMEENVGHGLTNGITGKFLDAGRVFFNAGERLNRIVGFEIAYKEARLAAGKGFRLTDEVKEQIMGRSDILTANMTNASSAAFQKNLGAIPFQFLTYQRNILEQLFGKQLSKNEKIRLAAFQATAFGAAGVPMVGALMDLWGYKNDTEVATYLRGGVVDWSLSEALGTDVSLSTRLGAGEGLWTTLRDAMDNPWDSLAGPGVATATDLFSTTKSLVKTVASGGSMENVEAHIIRTANNVSSLGKITKTVMAYRYGEYVSNKSNRTVIKGLDNADAIAIFLGLPLRDVNASYNISRFMKMEDGQIEAYKNEFRTTYEAYKRALQNEDYDKATILGADLDAALSVLNPYEFSKVKTVLTEDTDTAQRIAELLIRRGKYELAESLLPNYEE